LTQIYTPESGVTPALDILTDTLSRCAIQCRRFHWTLLALWEFLCGWAVAAVRASFSSYGLCGAENGRALMVSSARRDRAASLLVNSRCLTLPDLDDAGVPRLLVEWPFTVIRLDAARRLDVSSTHELHTTHSSVHEQQNRLLCIHANQSITTL